MQELIYDCFGFHSKLHDCDPNLTLKETYEFSKGEGTLGNILLITLDFEEFVDKATHK